MGLTNVEKMSLRTRIQAAHSNGLSQKEAVKRLGFWYKPSTIRKYYKALQPADPTERKRNETPD